MSVRPLPKTTPEIAWGEEMLHRLASGETSHGAIAPYQADETQLAAITIVSPSPNSLARLVQIAAITANDSTAATSAGTATGTTARM